MKFKMLKVEESLMPKSYNKYFLLYEHNNFFWVDGGNGNGLFSQLEKNNINWKDIKDIFLNHKDIDHVMGVIWMIRMAGQAMNKGQYDGDVRIYAHESLIKIIENIVTTLLNEKETNFIGDRLHLISVKDGDSYNIIGNNTTFFNVNSPEDNKLGFTMHLENDEQFTFMNKNHIEN